MINRPVARFLTSEKDLFRGMNLWPKRPLLVRLLGDPLNGLNDPRLETLQFNTTQLSPFVPQATQQLSLRENLE